MLNPEQLAMFKAVGFFMYRACLNERDVEFLRETTNICLQDAEDPGRVNESDGITARALHGTHLRNNVMAKLCRHPNVLATASELLDSDVYVHQFKISIKAAFVGDVWEWHQDFTFYNREDELPSPEIVTVALFIDDVTDFNGPLIVIPGSQKEGFLTSTRNFIAEFDQNSSWLSNTTAKLRYTVDREVLKKMTAKYGLLAAKGKAGDAIVFHSNLFHCSGVNMSPLDRRVIFISYNAVDNIPKWTREPRPEFLAARNFQPLSAYTAEALADTNTSMVSK